MTDLRQELPSLNRGELPEERDNRMHFLMDSQILSAVQTCPWKAYASFIQHLRSKGMKARAISLGTLTHEVFHVYYNGIIKGRNKDMEEAIKIVRPHSPNIVEDAQDSELVFDLCRRYVSYYGNDPWMPKSVEQAGAKILFEDDKFVIGYVCKIDLVVDGPNYTSVPVDHKTESRYSEPSKLSDQFIGYCWYTGKSIIFVNKLSFAKTVTDDRRFRRYELKYSDDEVKEWTEDAVYWAKQLIIYIKDEYFPRNRTSCDKFSGCNFKPVCEARLNARSYILNAMFKHTEPWDPMKMESLEA